MSCDGQRDTNKSNNSENYNKAAGRPSVLPEKVSLTLPSSQYFTTGMKRGFIKFWRKTEDWVFMDKPRAVALWVHLLIQAKHPRKDGKPLKKTFKGEIIEIKDGQMLTGRRFLSCISGISENTIEKYLRLFEKEKQITQQKSTKNRLITIINWDKYQAKQNGVGSKVDDELTDELPSKKTQYENNKNNKNNKDKERRFTPPSIKDISEYCKERGNSVDATTFHAFYEAKGWYIGKNKMKSWKQAIITWEQRSPKRPVKRDPDYKTHRKENDKRFQEAMRRQEAEKERERNRIAGLTKGIGK